MTPNPQDSAIALEVERAAFETWAGSLDSWLPNIKRSGDRYVSAVTAAAWHAWQKRASQSDGTSGGWQPIETAPKDGSDVLLYCKGKGVVRGRWNDCRFATLPRPYWTNDREHLWGVLSTRIDQPTHWMHLPAAPTQGENHVG